MMRNIKPNYSAVLFTSSASSVSNRQRHEKGPTDAQTTVRTLVCTDIDKSTTTTISTMPNSTTQRTAPKKFANIKITQNSTTNKQNSVSNHLTTSRTGSGLHRAYSCRQLTLPSSPFLPSLSSSSMNATLQPNRKRISHHRHRKQNWKCSLNSTVLSVIVAVFTTVFSGVYFVECTNVVTSTISSPSSLASGVDSLPLSNDKFSVTPGEEDDGTLSSHFNDGTLNSDFALPTIDGQFKTLESLLERPPNSNLPDVDDGNQQQHHQHSQTSATEPNGNGPPTSGSLVGNLCAAPEVLVNGSPSPDIAGTVSGGDFSSIEEIQFVGVVGPSSSSGPRASDSSTTDSQSSDSTNLGRQKRICKIKCLNGVWIGPLCALQNADENEPILQSCSVPIIVNATIIVNHNSASDNNRHANNNRNEPHTKSDEQNNDLHRHHTNHQQQHQRRNHHGHSENNEHRREPTKVKAGDKLAHGTMISVHCNEVGLYKLDSDEPLQCIDGLWNRAPPKCVPTTIQQNFSLDSPPTILYTLLDGTLGLDHMGRLVVLPGTILHLDCLFRKNYGQPKWTVTNVTQSHRTGGQHPASAQASKMPLSMQSKQMKSHPNHKPASQEAVQRSQMKYHSTSQQSSTTQTNLNNNNKNNYHHHHIHHHHNHHQWKSSQMNPTQTTTTTATTTTTPPATTSRSYTTGWAILSDEHSWKYRLAIYYATEADSGKYTCTTPNGLDNSIIIQVQDTECRPIDDLTESTFDPNRVISVEGHRMHDRAQFSCTPGYRLSGQSVLQCQSNGQWSHPVPTCISLESGGSSSDLKASSLDSLSFSSSSTTTSKHSKSEGKANQNVDGSAADDTVSSAMIHCSGIDRTKLDSKLIVKSVTKKSSSRVPVLEQYRRQKSRNPKTPGDLLFEDENDLGEDSFTNIRNGDVWNDLKLHNNIETDDDNDEAELFDTDDADDDDDEDNVRQKKADDANEEDDNEDEDAENETFRTVLQFDCQPGYRLSGPKSIVCSHNSHRNRPFPICEQITCDEPTIEPGSGVQLLGATGHYLIGDSVQFECTSNHILLGEPISTCLPNGTWSFTPPNCKPICEFPPQIEYGFYSPIKFAYDLNEKVNVYCDTGYELRKRTQTSSSASFSSHSSSFSSSSSSSSENDLYEPEVRNSAYLKCDPNGKWSGRQYECVPTL